MEPHSAHARALATKLAGDLPYVDVQVSTTPDEAVAGADVVSAATSATRPLFQMRSLSPHAHVNAVGSYRPSMAELPTDLLLTASTLAVDDVRGCVEESGEVAAAIAAGLATSRLTGLGDLVDAPPVRTGRTVFKSVGCAALDFAVGDLLANHLDSTTDHHPMGEIHEHQHPPIRR